MKIKTTKTATPKVTAKVLAVIPTTPSAIARVAGVSRQLAGRKLRQGKSPRQIIAEAVRRREMLAQRAVRSAAAAKSSEESFASAQRRYTSASANLHELRLAIARCELVDATMITNLFSNAVVKFRDRMLRIGPEQRDVIAAMTDPAAIGRLLSDQVMQAFAELERGLEAAKELGKGGSK